MAKVKMVFDAEEAKAVHAFVRLEDKQKKLEQTEARMAAKRERHVKRNDSLTKDLTDSISSQIVSWASVAGAITAATTLLAKYNAERKRGAEVAKTFDEAYMPAAQVLAPEEYQRVKKEAQGSMARYGLSGPEAGKLAKDLVYAGKTDKLDFYGGLKGPVDDVSAVASMVTKFQSAMTKKETGGDRAVLNKMLTASSITNADLNQIADASMVAATSVAGIGGRDEELLAGISATVDAFKSPDIAANKLKSFADAATNKGLTGGLTKIVEDLRSKNMSQKHLKKYLGSSEALQGYNQLVSNWGTYETQLSEIDKAQYMDQEKDRVARMRRTARKGSGGTLSANKAQAGGDATDMALYGERRLNQEAMAENQSSLNKQSGMLPTGRMAADFMMYMGKLFNLEPGTIEYLGGGTTRDKFFSDEKLPPEQREMIDAIKENTAEIKRASRVNRNRGTEQ